MMPHSHPDPLFFADDCQCRYSTGALYCLYTLAGVESALLAYIEKHDLVYRVGQQYLNLNTDDVFSAALYGSPNSKGGILVPEFAKREEALGALRGPMEPWFRTAIGSDEPITKKGALRPIVIATKTRQGRKTCTLITGFGPCQLSLGYPRRGTTRAVCVFDLKYVLS